MKRFISVLFSLFLVSFVFADINVPDITDNIISISDATINRIDGNISSNGQKDVYSFTAPRDGCYRFEMSELRGATVRLMAWDSFEQPIADSSNRGNGQGITLDLVGGQTYQIQVGQYSGLSPYRLIIGHQKETIDISRLTGLNDSIQYTDQRNVYLFTAPRNGSYRFEMAELRSATVRLMAWDRLDYPPIADSSNRGNGQGITLDLVGGQTYQIQVRQYSGVISPYHLIIGHQKETIVIDRPDRVNDRIQYTAQRNTYTFIPPSDGRYRFEMSELRGATVRLMAWDRLDYPPIADSSNRSNGQGITLDLVGGQSYQIQVGQYSGLSAYSLVISRQ